MEKVVLALDGGPASDAAIEWVIERARGSAIDLTLTAVFEAVGQSVAAISEDFRAVYDGLLSRAAERIAAELPSLQPHSVVRTGRPSTELVRASADADLLVVGTSRHGTADGAVYGTLPLRLAATAACATAVVPAGWRAGETVAELVGTGKAPVLSPTIVGVDALHPQLSTLEFAGREARRSGTALTVVHAWHVPTLLAVTLFGHPSVWTRIGEEHQGAFERVLEIVRNDNPDLVLREILREGPVSRVLVDEASGAGALILGRHAASTPTERLLGATSHDVLLNMPCPVIVVPA